MPKRYKSKTMEAVHETAQGLRSVGAITARRMSEFDDMCVESEPTTASNLAFHMIKGAKSEWRWSLTGSNGQIIATSGEGYKSKRDCLAAIALVKSSANAKVAA